MNPFDRVLRARVTIELPGGKQITRAMNFDMVESGMETLPRDREIMPCSAMHALNQMNQRRMACRNAGAKIAEMLLEAIEATDPKNGYSPEENAAFFTNPDNQACPRCASTDLAPKGRTGHIDCNACGHHWHQAVWGRKPPEEAPDRDTNPYNGPAIVPDNSGA